MNSFTGGTGGTADKKPINVDLQDVLSTPQAASSDDYDKISGLKYGRILDDEPANTYSNPTSSLKGKLITDITVKKSDLPIILFNQISKYKKYKSSVGDGRLKQLANLKHAIDFYNKSFPLVPSFVLKFFHPKFKEANDLYNKDFEQLSDADQRFVLTQYMAMPFQVDTRFIQNSPKPDEEKK